MIKPRGEEETEGSQDDQEAEDQEEDEEEAQEGPRGANVSDFTRVNREELGQPEGTAGQERALRLGAGAGVRGGSGAGEKARPAQPGPVQPEAGASRRQTYRDILCNTQNVERRITRIMAKA